MRLTDARPLDGRVALVTGASNDVGAAIAKHFARAGATVALTARDEPSLKDTADAIDDFGGRAFLYPADLAQPGDRASLVEGVLGRLARVDVLVNNAAVTFLEPVSRMAESRLELMLEVQVRAPLDLTRRVLPGMRSRRLGWILNISSRIARHPDGPPYPESAAAGGLYGACTAALERLTTGLAAEVVNDNVAVNALSPSDAWPDAFAEAALVLCGGTDQFLTGHVTTSDAMLRMVGLAE